MITLKPSDIRLVSRRKSHFIGSQYYIPRAFRGSGLRNWGEQAELGRRGVSEATERG